MFYSRPWGVSKMSFLRFVDEHGALRRNMAIDISIDDEYPSHS